MPLLLASHDTSDIKKKVNIMHVTTWEINLNGNDLFASLFTVEPT